MSVSKNRNIIFDAGLSSLGARTRPTAVGAVARGNRPPDAFLTRALRVPAFLSQTKNKTAANATVLFLAGAQGLEPWTCSFGDCRSTN